MKHNNKLFCDLCEKETPNIWPQGNLEVCPACTKMIMARSNRILHVIKEAANQIRSFDRQTKESLLKNSIFEEVVKLDKEFSETMGKTYKIHTRKRSFIDFLSSISENIKTQPVADNDVRDIDLD